MPRIQNKSDSSINPANKVELFAIELKMREAGLSSDFIVETVEVALKLEGAADLMFLWAEETDQEERDEIIADIQDLINANKQMNRSEELYVKFNDLETIAKNIRAYKDSLYQEVIKFGGISKLSELTGIPQPSLSRFFNSNAMPQKATIFKIAKALDLKEIKLDIMWGK